HAEPTGTYRAALRTCDGSAGAIVSASSLAGLESGRMQVASAPGPAQTTSSVPRGQPMGVAADRLTRADVTKGRVEGSGPVPEPDPSKGTINQSIGCVQVPLSALRTDGAAGWQWPFQQEVTLIGGPLALLDGTAAAPGVTSVDA